MSQFSKWLESAMFNRGGRKYRQADLARDIHKHPNAISDWLNDDNVPGRDDIAKLARHFGVTSRFIYGLIGESPPEDLNDTLDEIDAITYRFTKSELGRLLRDLRENYRK